MIWSVEFMISYHWNLIQTVQRWLIQPIDYCSVLEGKGERSNCALDTDLDHRSSRRRTTSLLVSVGIEAFFERCRDTGFR